MTKEDVKNLKSGDKLYFNFNTYIFNEFVLDLALKHKVAIITSTSNNSKYSVDISRIQDDFRIIK